MDATHELTLADFDYALPSELIAQQPLPDRAASRLLHVDGDRLADLHFRDIETLLVAGDVLVFNDTKVIKARLLGRKPSGGKVELLVERIVEPRRALALVRTSHAPKPGSVFEFGHDLGAPVTAEVLGRQNDFFELRFSDDVLALLDHAGHVPLPPYIHHGDTAEDVARYQTVYAAQPGAVAAPTAGLHFTEALLTRLRAKGVQCVYVTLHVGAGTFQPVRVDRIAEHRMHSEWYSIAPAAANAINAARASGRRIVAIGTTSLRALESAAHEGRVQAGARDTALFITPGFRFQIVDRLITNFHLPKSTLLMLVSAFAGMQTMRRAYAHAVEQRYRFFSYGDASLLERAP
ncbi:MAG: tRNA preQ1(34) S-adenosylmethionine ribosyltransferase-isomerase QueA [Betaproteobacteria bacterium]